MATSLKLIYNGEARRIPLKTEYHNYQRLVDQCKNLFGVANNSPFHILWTDSDNDDITVSSDLELEESIRLMSLSSSTITFKLQVEFERNNKRQKVNHGTEDESADKKTPTINARDVTWKYLRENRGWYHLPGDGLTSFFYIKPPLDGKRLTKGQLKEKMILNTDYYSSERDAVNAFLMENNLGTIGDKTKWLDSGMKSSRSTPLVKLESSDDDNEESSDEMSVTPVRKIKKESTPHRDTKYTPHTKRENTDHDECAYSGEASLNRSRSSSTGTSKTQRNYQSPERESTDEEYIEIFSTPVRRAINLRKHSGKSTLKVKETSKKISRNSEKKSANTLSESESVTSATDTMLKDKYLSSISSIMRKGYLGVIKQEQERQRDAPRQEDHQDVTVLNGWRGPKQEDKQQQLPAVINQLPPPPHQPCYPSQITSTYQAPQTFSLNQDQPSTYYNVQPSQPLPYQQPQPPYRSNYSYQHQTLPPPYVAPYNPFPYQPTAPPPSSGYYQTLSYN